MTVAGYQDWGIKANIQPPSSICCLCNNCDQAAIKTNGSTRAINKLPKPGQWRYSTQSCDGVKEAKSLQKRSEYTLTIAIGGRWNNCRKAT